MVMSWMHYASRPEVLGLLVGALAIVVGGTVAIVKRLIAHRERMAMIAHGIHPEYPPEEVDSSAQSWAEASQLRDTRAHQGMQPAR
jgi:hypothetical protein